MLECIWYAFAAVFIFIGMTATVYLLFIRIFKNNACGEYIIAIPASADDGDIGAALYCAHMRQALLGDLCSGRVIVVDTGMSESQKKLCLGIMKECGNMELRAACDFSFFTERETDGQHT